MKLASALRLLFMPAASDATQTPSKPHQYSSSSTSDTTTQPEANAEPGRTTTTIRQSAAGSHSATYCGSGPAPSYGDTIVAVTIGRETGEAYWPDTRRRSSRYRSSNIRALRELLKAQWMTPTELTEGLKLSHKVFSHK